MDRNRSRFSRCCLDEAVKDEMNNVENGKTKTMTINHSMGEAYETNQCSAKARLLSCTLTAFRRAAGAID